VNAVGRVAVVPGEGGINPPAEPFEGKTGIVLKPAGQEIIEQDVVHYSRITPESFPAYPYGFPDQRMPVRESIDFAV